MCSFGRAHIDSSLSDARILEESNGGRCSLPPGMRRRPCSRQRRLLLLSFACYPTAVLATPDLSPRALRLHPLGPKSDSSRRLPTRRPPTRRLTASSLRARLGDAVPSTGAREDGARVGFCADACADVHPLWSSVRLALCERRTVRLVSCMRTTQRRWCALRLCLCVPHGVFGVRL